MVICHYCDKGASLQFLHNGVKLFTCVGCKKEKNIQNTFSRLNCCMCESRGCWTLNGMRYCYEHKPEKSITGIPKCTECKITNATFGIIGYPPLFCFKCCDKNIHVNLKTKKCIICNKNAYFKLPNETTPKYCGDCKTPEMKSIKSTYCTECDNYAYYGNIGLSPKRCKTHKSDDMIFMRPKQYLSTEKFITNVNKKRKIEIFENFVKNKKN